MPEIKLNKRVLRQSGYALLPVLVVIGLLSAVAVQAVGSNESQPAWASPSVMALRKVSALTNPQNQPNLLSNLDCGLMTYRTPASASMQTGCFTPTAFGLLDSDSDTVIFNGTDEALQLLPYSPHQVLAPWPQALDLVALDAANTGGSYISLYKNSLAGLQDQRNFLGQLTGKQLTGPPELPLRAPDGQRLVINAQSLAFSDNGWWLVAEDLNGSFVRINLATLDMVPFAPAFGALGSPALLKSQVAVSSNGRYVAIENNAASAFKVYDLATCSGNSSDLRPLSCQVYDYWPFLQRQIGGLQSIRHVRFVNDGLLGFEASVTDATSGGLYELAPTASITSLTDYIGLGDSYTSGEGAFDYLAGTDTDDNMCHLSGQSYPLLLTRDLFSTSGGHSVACSGAVINDIGSTNGNYRGQVRGVADLQQLEQTQPALLEAVETNFVPGYIAQQRFVKRYQPAVVTASVGGDDIGFGDILQNCVTPHFSLHFSDNTCYNTYEDRLELMKLIDRTVPSWTGLYKQLSAESPGTRLYAIGYPVTVADTGSCALNVHLNQSEREFAREFTAYLNRAIEQAAQAAKVSYVDISHALAGHRLCETASYNVAVNGLTAGKDAGPAGLKVFGKESYHPNALGHTLIEQAILAQTHNLAGAASNNTANSGAGLLANAPKSGRPVNTLVPVLNLAARVLGRGSNNHLNAAGLASGLRPNSTYQVRLDGASGTVLGTVTSDVNGNISTMITIPDTTGWGGHTVDITGENQAGELVDVTQPVYVPSSPNDSDGDGLPDTDDSCPGTPNSGQDADQDGIDDTCDSFITQPPGSGGQNSNESAETGNSNGQTSNPGSGSSGGTGSSSSSNAGQGSASGDMPPQPGQAPLVFGSGMVASFRTDGPGTPATKVAVLSAAIARPNGIRLNTAELPSQGQTGASGPGHWYKPGVTRWLPLLILPIIFWLLLLLLSLVARHIVDQASGF